jgi:hypothetical protein
VMSQTSASGLANDTMTMKAGQCCLMFHEPRVERLDSPRRCSLPIRGASFLVGMPEGHDTPSIRLRTKPNGAVVSVARVPIGGGRNRECGSVMHRLPQRVLISIHHDRRD